MDDLRSILAARESLYGKADAVVDTSKSAVDESLGCSENRHPRQMITRSIQEVPNMAQAAVTPPTEDRQLVTFDAHPDTYRHWQLSFDGSVATWR